MDSGVLRACGRGVPPRSETRARTERGDDNHAGCETRLSDRSRVLSPAGLLGPVKIALPDRGEEPISGPTRKNAGSSTSTGCISAWWMSKAMSRCTPTATRCQWTGSAGEWKYARPRTSRDSTGCPASGRARRIAEAEHRDRNRPHCIAARGEKSSGVAADTSDERETRWGLLADRPIAHRCAVMFGTGEPAGFHNAGDQSIRFRPNPGCDSACDRRAAASCWRLRCRRSFRSRDRTPRAGFPHGGRCCPCERR